MSRQNVACERSSPGLNKENKENSFIINIQIYEGKQYVFLDSKHF